MLHRRCPPGARAITARALVLVALLVLLLLLPAHAMAQSDDLLLPGSGASALPITAIAASQPPLNPVLSNVNIRRAIAQCIDRPAILTKLYPTLSQSERDGMLMDTFLPKDHALYSVPPAQYQYALNPAAAHALLDGAGWTLAPGATYRTNAAGKQLVIKFLTTNSGYRLAYGPLLETQLRDNCGIRLLRSHLDANTTFGALPVREFELAAYAWVGEPSPGVWSLYACDAIPGAENGLKGQNSMGWCNSAADAAIARMNTTLDAEVLKQQYSIVQQEFAKDMVSLPLHQRIDAYATDKRLQNYQPDPTEYDTWNAWQWNLPGISTLISYGDEPLSLSPATSTGARQRIAELLFEGPYSSLTYAYQPVLLTALPTLESGMASTQTVQVTAGDQVMDVNGEVVALAPGVTVRHASGITATYASGNVSMIQIAAHFQYRDGIRWSDGSPLKQADLELGRNHDCDPATQGLGYYCYGIARADFSGIGYTVTYVPGNMPSLYFLPPFNIYPSHQVIQSSGPHHGKALAQVPHGDWLSVPEHTRSPLSIGPYRIVAWDAGVQMELAPNPYYWRGNVLNFSKLIIKFGPQSDDDVANNRVHIVYGMGMGQYNYPNVTRYFIKSATWEHMDFNLNLFVQAAAEMLPAGGGTVATETGVQLTVPSGAVSAPTTFVVDEMVAPTQSTGAQAPLRTLSLTAANAGGDAVSTFGVPLRLQITYSDDELRERGFSESTLRVVTWNGAEMQTLFPCASCTHDANLNIITVPVLHFSEVVLTAQAQTFLPTVRSQ